MNAWQVLGLSPCGDPAAVKRAYAEKAKTCHPEDHPDQFRVLHEAYREALRYAKQHPEQKAAAPVTASPSPARQNPFRDAKNARRTYGAYAQDDEMSLTQLKHIRQENRTAASTLYHGRTSSVPSLRTGKLPIRGAVPGCESGDLDFSLLESADAETDSE